MADTFDPTTHKLGCGGCGCESFMLYRHSEDALCAVCTECKSPTIIKVRPPKLDLCWPSQIGDDLREDGEGLLGYAD